MMKGVLFVLLFSVALGVELFRPEPKPLHKNGWVRSRRSSFAATTSIQIALKREFSSVTSALYDVSLPSSPHYGQHKTAQQVQDMTRPSASTIKAVTEWTRKNRLNCKLIAGHSDWMECPHVSVGKLSKLLHTTFYDFTHAKAPGVALARCEYYSIPVELAEHIDFIGGVKRLPSMRTYLQRIKKKRKENAQYVTPTRSRELWKVGSAKGSTDNGNLQEVAQFLGQFMATSDLDQFWSDFQLPHVNVTINGPNDPSNPGDEASLDIQTITGVNQGTPTLFTVTPGLNQNKQEPFLKWLLALADMHKSAYVHSVSYGDDENSLDTTYLTRVDQEFQKLGLKGHTFVYASGDSGVDCRSNGHQNPDFPASSPHVLTVGGTVDQGGSQTPQSWSGSGGGFSDFFEQPSFMSQAHQAYLNGNNNLPPSDTFNHTGRGYPDVSAIAWDVVLVVGGQDGLVGGTSCAAPAVAGILSLLNDIRISQNKPVLGYVTPLMYQSSTYPSGFVNIVSGPSNSAGGCQGFQPAAGGGWSPITGFGGIDFEGMSKIVSSLN